MCMYGCMYVHVHMSIHSMMELVSVLANTWPWGIGKTFASNMYRIEPSHEGFNTPRPPKPA